MTSKEKAEELVNKFKIKVGVYYTEDSVPCVVNATMLNNSAKQCALICVDEMLQVIPMYIGNLNPTWKYWNEVKEELLKL